MEPNVFIDTDYEYPIHTVVKTGDEDEYEFHIPPDMLSKISRVMKEFNAVQNYLDDKIKGGTNDNINIS